MSFLAVFLFLHLFQTCVAQRLPTRDVSECTCGFYDQELDAVFTDSTIVYFNETDVFPLDNLVVEEYEHRYDRGWNTLYREGAIAQNVEVSNDTTARNLQSLAMYCNPSTDDHLVQGSSIRTARQDIFFGSFRSSLRSPRSWKHGSALSMLVHHNQTESWDIDVMNTNNGSGAWISMLAKGQFSNLWLGRNFSTLLPQGVNPWYYTEYRVDWTRDRIDYYIGGQLQQSFTKEINHTLPSTPAPIRWKHWSAGNEYNTQGPPLSRSAANIGWTRLFFNSSVMTDAQHEAFDTRCRPVDACSMSDNSLRGSSQFPAEAIKKWKQIHPKRKIPWVPLTIDIVFASIFTVVVAKTLLRRLSWKKLESVITLRKDGSVSSSTLGNSNSGPDTPTIIGSSTVRSSSDGSRPQSFQFQQSHSSSNSTYHNFEAPPLYSGTHTPAPLYQTPVMSRINSIDDLRAESHSGAQAQRFRRNGNTKPLPVLPDVAPKTNADIPDMNTGPLSSAVDVISVLPDTPGASTPGLSQPIHGIPELVAEQPQPPRENSDNGTEEKKTAETTVKEVPSGSKNEAPAPVKRVDYLAGFISMSAILVTLNHFGLTFWAAVIIPSVLPHYSSETWARKTIATYFLDPLWIGPFLMISTRFLVSNYLRTGRLDNMAQKIVARPFRLLTPVASIAILEYFLMDSGALAWLEYLPSVTWSPWPFTAIVANPGVFISEIIQLAFLIPNAAPMITYNYCTGVLWTIPVQLQGAWQTLLALIVIKEVKTPWKRFLFYAFCIANHWYGLSWGSYYYAGLLLADLEITFKYKKWLYAHPFVYYPFLWLMIAVALGGFTIDVIVQYTGIQYATYEYGWHPDVSTGLSISQAGHSVYPDYFIPRLNALLATVSMQLIVEISPAVQKVLSVKILQWIFPHIFTIYLIHGFIFWSVGSWAMVSLWSYGLPYWLCVLLTAIVSYGVLFASLPILTPPIEMVGKNFTLSLWEHASQEPIKRKPTTYPFGKELLFDRGQTIEVEDSSKDKGKEKDTEEKPFPEWI